MEQWTQCYKHKVYVKDFSVCSLLIFDNVPISKKQVIKDSQCTSLELMQFNTTALQ